MILVKNWKNFPSLFLSIKYRKIIFLDILDRKRSILNILAKYEFFQRGQPMVSVKNWKITSSLFLGIINLKMLPPDILDRIKY